MSRRVVIEVILEADIQNEEQLLARCLSHFRQLDWSDDPSGTALARTEDQVRANLDQAGLQNIVRPSRLLDGIPGVAPTGGALVTVRNREPNERLPWDPR